jgi:hypothetical protein
MNAHFDDHSKAVLVCAGHVPVWAPGLDIREPQPNFFRFFGAKPANFEIDTSGKKFVNDDP